MCVFFVVDIIVFASCWDLLSLAVRCLSALNFAVSSLRLLARDGDFIANLMKRNETNKFLCNKSIELLKEFYKSLVNRL